MLLQLENITFTYASRALAPTRVFSNLNLTVAEGECVALCGEEGSGKSTLLQLINGLLKPDAGRVTVAGRDMWQNPKRLHEIRRNFGFAFQFPEQQFFCETVKDEMLFAARNFRLREIGEERCAAAIAELGLAENYLLRSPFSLSMGEARRVALASILVHDPAIFLLDEPTAGLDGFGMRTVMNLMLRLKLKRKTIIFASHDEDLIARVASREIALQAGAVPL